MKIFIHFIQLMKRVLLTFQMINKSATNLLFDRNGTVTYCQHKIGKYKNGISFLENYQKYFYYESKEIFTESITNL